eukprot:scaffold295801_cov29-Prasinocladus_malaysianus.AAC.1
MVDCHCRSELVSGDPPLERWPGGEPKAAAEACPETADGPPQALACVEIIRAAGLKVARKGFRRAVVKDLKCFSLCMLFCDFIEVRAFQRPEAPKSSTFNIQRTKHKVTTIRDCFG